MTDHIEIIETKDGSKTLYDAEKQVHYRNIHGARTESRYVFLNGTGIIARPTPWRVLELGFGAGVNFTQTVEAFVERAAESTDDDARLEYHSVDYAPVAPELLDFHSGEAGEMARRALSAVARDEQSKAGEVIEIIGFDGRVVLKLYPQKWLAFDEPGLQVDAVYFDPFGPRTEPDSWTSACFEVAARHMSDRAVLGTYSAATRVKRAMFAAGLTAASAPGPGRKREVTFASKDPATLAARDDLDVLAREKYLVNEEEAGEDGL